MKLKRIIAVILICVIGGVMTACDSDSGSNQTASSNGICKFDGCTRKATSIGGGFCDYHNKALNDYWNAQN